MAASKRCIFLTGAPYREDLNWDEANFRTAFTVPVKRFLKDEQPLDGYDLTQATPPPTYTKWRHLPLDERLPSTSDDDTDVEKRQFLSFYESDEATGQDGFLDSIAELEEMNPNDIAAHASMPDDVGNETRFKTSFVSATSFTATSFSSMMSETDMPFDIPQVDSVGRVAITGLKRIPNAEYINRIQPQTMTVNLIVGIISISAIRTMRLRRGNKTMDIVDVTVGDETRAGFGISFWLAPLDSQRKPVDDLRNILMQLRTGDVVLLRNVALSSWNGCVFGKSLSRRFARNSTSIAVTRDTYNEMKVRKVREWVSDFVGVARRKTATKTHRNDTDRVLPPDTQDDTQD